LPRTCLVCVHPQRKAIDRALVSGEPGPSVSAKWGVSPDSVKRHKAAHLPLRLVQQQTLDEAREALDVMQQLKAINAASLEVLRKARDGGQGALVLVAVDRVLRQLEFQAKLMGELSDAPQVNVLISPEWHQVRAVLLVALHPYPEARAAVALQLAALEPAHAR
jgi:hypothetical protein